ncbi:MAG: 4Fe-4S dicluster domain-containing protein, partial [Geodermatophilaceae bacterium]|nr:4Fe-4S dicluster domain-containing protein [Geodermatophilaceae bacterium]
DSAVPPDRLGDYLRAFENLLTEHHLSGLPYGHFGDGCVHIRLDFTLDADPGRAAFRRFLTEAADLVAAHGGSLSGEHGDGRARSELLTRMYSAAALRVMAEVKAIFDPAGVLNPGIVTAPRPVDADLRGVGSAGALAEFGREVQRCTGVGTCRADRTDVGGVMCPSYLATRDEKDSTRGRSRVLQELVDGRLVQGWRSPEVRDSLDLCLSCKACAAECPTGVDMATYKSQVLDEAWRGRFRPPSHYALGWLPTWARVAARTPRLANAVLGSPLAGPGKRLAGVDPRRDLPPLAGQSFRAWFTARPRPPDGEPVLLWVDTFTDLFTPQVGRAAVKVLERAGYAVRIPDRPQCCGLTWISTGQREHARKILRRSISDLAGAMSTGTPVVGLEPSCVGVLRGDVADLLDADAARTGAAVLTLAELLTGAGHALPDLTGVRAVAQPHCHHHAVMGWDTDARLLREAGAQITRVGGCCGLAGNFGAERGHHDVSVAIAEHALLPAVRRDPGAVVLTDGFSCRTQLRQLGHRDGIHLAELLAAQPL